MLLMPALAALLIGVPSLPDSFPSSVPAFSHSPLGFGAAVVIDGDKVIVGKSGVAVGFPTPPNTLGAVYVFSLSADGAWKESASFSGSGTKFSDGFGSSLALDVDWLAVGAPKQGNGAVYVFQRRGTGWAEVARLPSPETATGDEFGKALALRNGVLLIGAPERDSARGAVYMSRRDSRGGWSAPVLMAAGTVAGEGLGRALTFDGRRALVGAPGELQIGPGAGAPLQRGRVISYRVSTSGGWTADGGIEPVGDSIHGFGAAIHMIGNEVAIGAPMSFRSTGVVITYARDGSGTWSETSRAMPAERAPQAFGLTVAGTMSEMLVGAPVANGLKGAVHVLKRDGSQWVHAQVMTAPVRGFGALLGMALDAKGGLAAAGAPLGEFFEGAGYAWRSDASGNWKLVGDLADAPSKLPAVSGGEVRCTDRQAGGFTCQQVDLLSFIPTADLGASRGIMLNDIWGWTDQASKREFALVGRMDGTAFVEVTNPSRPVYLGSLPMHEGANPNLWRDIKVYKDHAFIVADGSGPHGMQVFDLRQLLTVSGAPKTFTETAHYDRIASAHNIAINEETGFAYTIGNSAGGETCGGALHMINISEPARPVFAGCFADPSTGNAKTGYTHDNQCVTYKGPDARYKGREICFNSSETAVGIADVTDKSAPKAISVASYPNTAYTHQGWLDEAQEYFYVNDEGDEVGGLVPRTRTLVWDVKNLEEPVLVKEFLGTNSASDHNLYVRGNYMFQSNYVSGLRVIDISDRANPREVGFFDTVPMGENVPGFAGSWSNYPYFPSGTIVVTSMREGLFVVRHRPQEATP